MLDAANDAIIIDDHTGAIAYANRAFLELFAFAAETDIRALNLEDYIHPDDRQRLRERHDRRVAGEEVPDRFEYRGVRSDGVELVIEVNVTPVEHEGRLIGTHSILRDVTQRARREQRDRQRQKMETVGRMAAGLAHDFNNVISGVLAHIDLAELEEGCRSEHLEVSRQGMLRAAAMVRQLLGFARAEGSQIQRMDVDAVAREVATLVHGSVIQGNRVELVTALRAEHPIAGNPTQVHQIIQNLVLNARDAMPEGGTIVIRTEVVHVTVSLETAWAHVPPGRYVRLSIEDDGPGIAPEVRTHILEPFFTTKTSGLNSGLGLSTVYSIVQQHGAHLDLETEPGAGTTFSIYFRAASGSSALASPR